MGGSGVLKFWLYDSLRRDPAISSSSDPLVRTGHLPSFGSLRLARLNRPSGGYYIFKKSDSLAYANIRWLMEKRCTMALTFQYSTRHKTNIVSKL